MMYYMEIWFEIKGFFGHPAGEGAPSFELRSCEGEESCWRAVVLLRRGGGRHGVPAWLSLLRCWVCRIPITER